VIIQICIDDYIIVVPIIHNNKKQRAISRDRSAKHDRLQRLNKACKRRHKGSGRMSKSPKLRLRVDQEKCQGHARCKSLAPELFELDEFGNAHEIGDGSVPAGLEDKAWLAKANCPEIAIDVTEE